MISIIKLAMLGTASFLFIFLGGMFFLRILEKYKKLEKGFFYLVPYIIILIFALGTISLGRDLSAGMYAVVQNDEGFPSWVRWIQRLTTLILLFISFERIVNGFLNKRYKNRYFWSWFFVLFIFWFTTVFTAAVFSDHPHLSHEYFYPLIFFIATLFLTEKDKVAFIYACRNALIGFMLVSWLFVFIHPSLVLEFDFIQGFIPGLPRFAGVAPHAVTFASLVVMLAVFLFFIPVKNVLVNRVLWSLVTLSILLAQSKTVWVMSLFFVIFFFIYKEIQTNIVDGKISKRFVLKFIPFTGVIVLIPIGYILLVGIDNLLTQDKIDQLSSLTGRDLIWATVLSDSRVNSIFGYGPAYFSDLSSSTGYLYITHGHNQFFDTLAKAGEVGVMGLAILTLFVIYNHIKKLFSKNGIFAFFIFLYLFIRSISETPLTNFGYSLDIIFLLVLVLLLTTERDIIIMSHLR